MLIHNVLPKYVYTSINQNIPPYKIRRISQRALNVGMGSGLIDVNSNILKIIIMQGQQMILNAQLINSAKFCINHANERELDLRSKNISAIADLYATMNYFQAIDLSNNLITRLENTHYLDRLVTLILNNNKISTIGNIGEFLPALRNLFLVGNRIKLQSEVNNLATCRSLTTLVLHGNPVILVNGYRRATLEALRSLEVLDFRKVEKEERSEGTSGG